MGDLTFGSSRNHQKSPDKKKTFNYAIRRKSLLEVLNLRVVMPAGKLQTRETQSTILMGGGEALIRRNSRRVEL